MQIDNSYSGKALSSTSSQATYNVFDLIDSYDELKAIVPEILDDDRLKGMSKSFYVICTNEVGYVVIVENFESASYETQSLFISKLLPQICEISNTEHGADLIYNMVLLSPSSIQIIINYIQYGLLYFGNFGSLLVCNILKSVAPIYLDTLLLQLINNFEKLSVSEPGSKMILKLIEMPLDYKYVRLIQDKVMKDFFVLCCSKHSYRIIRNWIQLYPQYMWNIVDLIIRTWRSDQPSIITLTNDQYAKYVIDIVQKHIDSLPDLKKIIQEQIKNYDPHHIRRLEEKAASVTKKKVDMVENKKVEKVKKTPAVSKMIFMMDPNEIEANMSKTQLRKKIQREKQKEIEDMIAKPFSSQFVPEKKPGNDEKRKENKVSEKDRMDEEEDESENDIPVDKSVLKVTCDSSDDNNKRDLSISLPVQMAFAFTNNNVKNNNSDSLIPDEDRKPLWDDMIDATPYYGFYTIPEDEYYIKPEVEEKTVKVISAQTVLHYEPDDNDLDLLEDGMQNLYPNLDIYEDYDDRNDWIIHDYDIDEIFEREREWKEEDFFKQLEFESHLTSIGLSGDSVEIDWKIGDNCEVCISEKTIYFTEKHISCNNLMLGEIYNNKDKWLVGKIFGLSKGKINEKSKMYQIKLPLNHNITVVSISEFMRPIIKYKECEKLK